MSKVLPIKFGVRQGLILGPTLFIVSTHTVPGAMASALDKFNLATGGDESTDGSSLIYADDTSGSRDDGDPVRVAAALSDMSNTLVEMASSLELALSGQKTQLLYAGPRAKVSMARGLPVRVGEATVSPSNAIEILGFIVNDRLSLAP